MLKGMRYPHLWDAVHRKEIRRPEPTTEQQALRDAQDAAARTKGTKAMCEVLQWRDKASRRNLSNQADDELERELRDRRERAGRRLEYIISGPDDKKQCHRSEAGVSWRPEFRHELRGYPLAQPRTGTSEQQGPYELRAQPPPRMRQQATPRCELRGSLPARLSSQYTQEQPQRCQASSPRKEPQRRSRQEFAASPPRYSQPEMGPNTPHNPNFGGSVPSSSRPGPETQAVRRRGMIVGQEMNNQLGHLRPPTPQNAFDGYPYFPHAAGPAPLGYR